MGIENLQGFSPEQQTRYVEMRASYRAEEQIRVIEGEIIIIQLRDRAGMVKAEGQVQREKRVENYDFTTTVCPADGGRERQRKYFEEVFTPSLQVPLANFNRAEEERLKKSFVRRKFLKSLGFGEPPYVFANWREEQTKNITFRIAQSPKNPSLFLIQTIINNGNSPFIDQNTLLEHILFSPDPNPEKPFDKPVKYWKEKVLGQKTSETTPRR